MKEAFVNMGHKYVYLFSEGDGSMKNLLGGKGANLAEMVRMGMPVPKGFTVTTEACTRYYDDGKVIAPEIDRPYLNGIKFFLAGSKDSESAEVRINGRRSEAASAALAALDWPRPEKLAAGRAYVILVEADHPEQEEL